MNRRNFFSVLIATVAVPISVRYVVAQPSDDPVLFVRDVYARRGRMTKNESEALFTREIRELWLAPKKARPKIYGAKFSVLFGLGWFPSDKITLGDISFAPTPHGTTEVIVGFTMNEKPRRAFVNLVREEGKWRISNVSYDRGPSYLTHLRSTR